MSRSRLGALCLSIGMAVLACGVVLPVAAAQDFKVESQIFLSDQKVPSNFSTTIFHAGSVYDFLDKPAEVFLCLPEQRKIVLLDLGHRSSTEIPFERVTEFMAEMRQRADKQSDPFVKFMIHPQFETQPDPATGTVTFSSPWLVYRVAAAPAPERAMATAYREFSDWNIRVSPMINAGARPPFARLIINERLAEQGLVPTEVSLTVTPKRGAAGRPTVIRSQHRLVSQLTETDLQRVARAKQSLANFSPVGIAEYRKLVE
jgi:hypothetical protein